MHLGAWTVLRCAPILRCFMKRIDTQRDMEEYLRDESRKTGSASAIYFPETDHEVAEILNKHPEEPITIQGARTGVTAGCVPSFGIVINLERMNRILSLDSSSPEPSVTVQPGLRLQTLRQHLLPYGLFFAPDPTEPTASIGGMVSCNASGARSFRHGATRNHVLSMEVILANGDKLRLARNQHQAKGHDFSLKTVSGRMLEGTLPDIPMPQVKKRTAGYHIQPNMDLIDLFIGAEGTLGIVTSIQLALLPVRRETWGAVLFLPDESMALELVRRLREGHKDSRPDALEFFGCDALALLQQAQAAGHILRDMEAIPSDGGCGLYAEYTANDRDTMMSLFQNLYHQLMAVGGDPAHAWAAMNRRGMDRLHEFRHGTPEWINTIISQRKKQHPALTKLGTDMSVPDDQLVKVMRLYREDLQEGGFESAAFGHMGDNHIHVNLLPRDMEEYAQGKQLFLRWADRIVSMGGSVSAEHGIGKLKTFLLKRQYPPEVLKSMKALKQVFDPSIRLNRGNILEI